jgi:hypothetical protein
MCVLTAISLRLASFTIRPDCEPFVVALEQYGSERIHQSLECRFTMPAPHRCSVESQEDGTKICSLHKQPLVETTRFEQRQGEGNVESESFQCSVSKIVFRFSGLNL